MRQYRLTDNAYEYLAEIKAYLIEQDGKRTAHYVLSAFASLPTLRARAINAKLQRSFSAGRQALIVTAALAREAKYQYGNVFFDSLVEPCRI